MEKLQRALEMARANRIETDRKNAPLRPNVPHEAATTDEQTRAWGALGPIEVDEVQLERRRIVAFRSGPFATHYDILRTRVRDECRKRGFKRIAITSAQPAAGKSTTLANLAFSFGRLTNQRTMVFDFDLRRPTLHTLLGQSPQADMGKLIRGDVPFGAHIQRYGANLAFGLNSGAVDHPSELLQSDRTQDFLNAVEGAYKPDLMLFDMPPFLAADDAHGFLQNIDGVLLLVEADKTTRNQLEVVEEKLSSLTQVIGVVLNKCAFPDETDAGAYGYDYY